MGDTREGDASIISVGMLGAEETISATLGALAALSGALPMIDKLRPRFTGATASLCNFYMRGKRCE